MMELGSADLVFLCFVCFWRECLALVRQCRKKKSLFLERIDSHCVCFEENQFRFCFRLRSSVFRREFAEFSKA